MIMGMIILSMMMQRLIKKQMIEDILPYEVFPTFEDIGKLGKRKERSL